MQIARLITRSRLFLPFLVVAVLSAAVPAQTRARLAKIEVLGIKRMTTAQVIALTGLEIGQPIDNSLLDAASDKLLKSGLFRHLSYRVHIAADQATVIFEIEESARNLPVVFENFVWFTDDELLAADGRQFIAQVLSLRQVTTEKKGRRQQHCEQQGQNQDRGPHHGSRSLTWPDAHQRELSPQAGRSV